MSSHHPYSLPQDYCEKFAISENNVLESIRYADWSLGEFFRIAQKSTWFNNTIFVLTADHSANQRDDYFKSARGLFLTPTIIYAPSFDIPPIEKPFVQQIDILPTVLDLLNVNDSVFCFGNSMFDHKKTFSINFIHGSYRFFSEDFVIIFNGEEITHLYYYKDDKYLQNNIYEQLKTTNQLPLNDINLMKAIIQTYNDVLIDNKMRLN